MSDRRKRSDRDALRARCAGASAVEVPGEGYHRNLIACQVACPVHTDARGYVRAIADGRFEEAYLIARGPNPFASICGRICGAPCEAACRRGRIPRVDDDGHFVGVDRPIAIRALKRFACERAGVEVRAAGDGARSGARLRAAASPPTPRRWRRCCAPTSVAASSRRSGQRVAIIGAGPAGLSAAHDLALMGFQPVVFESEPVAGRHARRRRARVPPAARADRARGRGDRSARRRDPQRRHGRQGHQLRRSAPRHTRR